MTCMATSGQRRERRTGALSRDRIVQAAIEILDREGEKALTFRALAAHLVTGPGAIFWHVANKGDVLSAATDDLVGRVLREVTPDAQPRQAIRDIAGGIFDVIDAHPWIGTQLSQEPWQPAIVRMLEAFGEQVQALGVPRQRQFDCATALVSYVLGLAGQYAAAARLVPSNADRSAFLATISDQWTRLDPAQYPFVHAMTTQIPEHDDRDQFLAGIDLILEGITLLS